MPERRREAAQHLVQSGSLSISQACRLTGLPRRSWYRPDPVQRRLERDQPIIDALDDLLSDPTLPAARVVRVLEQLKAERGLPKMIRVDNGSEMTSWLFTQWCAENGVTISYIEPGKPNQNAYIERFNKSYRNEVLAPPSVLLLNASTGAELGLDDKL